MEHGTTGTSRKSFVHYSSKERRVKKLKVSHSPSERSAVKARVSSACDPSLSRLSLRWSTKNANPMHYACHALRSQRKILRPPVRVGNRSTPFCCC